MLSGTWAAVTLVTLHLPPGGDSDALGVVLLASAAALLCRQSRPWTNLSRPLS